MLPRNFLLFLCQPYNIGIVSARPFTVLAEYGPPLFQRGVLHVYYQTLQLHVFIVHLHAHSSRVRIQEAKNLLEVCIKNVSTLVCLYGGSLVVNFIEIVLHMYLKM